MKIAVDAGCLGITDKRLKVGVYTVVKNLLENLGKIDRSNEYILYSFKPIEKGIMRTFGPNMRNIVVPSLGWLQVVLPLRLFLDKPNIFIAANQACPISIPFLQYKTLGIFYDIAFERYPELYSYAASVEKHQKTSRRLAHAATHIIAISRNTKNDLMKIYKISSKKITVAYPGAQHVSKIKKFTNKHPYFLFVGAFKKSKNIPTLLNAFSLFSKNQNNIYDLILVGGDKWLDPEIKRILETLPPSIRDRVKVLGFVNQEKLVSLYKGAVAFVSPSFYEGFGLPFIEAQSVGCPVIGSTTGSLPEIIGGSGILIDPKSTLDLANAMHELTKSAVNHLYAVKGEENVQRYSWKTFAKQVQSAIQHLQ